MLQFWHFPIQVLRSPESGTYGSRLCFAQQGAGCLRWAFIHSFTRQQCQVSAKHRYTGLDLVSLA